MTKHEVEQILKSAGKGSLEAAAAKFLGLEKEFKAAKGIPPGCEAAINAIVDECSQWKTADAEVRAEIDAYKSAKEFDGEPETAVEG